MILTWVLPITLSYLIGSINFSYILCTYLRGIDIRDHGSGNAGATNAFRVIGKTPAIVVGVLDALKGICSLGIGVFFSTTDIVVLLCGLAAIIGHNWPIFLGFRGGKGIATTLGICVLLFTYPTIIAGSIGILTIILTRYVSAGSLLFVLSIPIILFIRGYASEEILFGIVIAISGLIRHKDNIMRVVRGNEQKIY